jgi:hypothetical protein
MNTRAIGMFSVILGGFCFLGPTFAEVFKDTVTMETESVSHSGDI